MIAIIQCAAGKYAKGFLETKSGKRVLFVADPAKAPRTDAQVYARPDDLAIDGQTWRDTLLRYNENQDNPLGLLRAYELYENNVYRRFVKRFGIEKTFILSAGWGLISASFLTPYYDITFSPAVKKAAPYKFRHKTDAYRDLCQLSRASQEPIVFFGGKDYQPLFCSLTEDVEGQRFLFYNSAVAPTAHGCTLIRFNTTTRTNWHYECAKAFLDGEIAVA